MVSFSERKNIKYFIATPRMARYIVKSKEVISIYLDFINEDDLHVYSIDEAFLDLTNYLKFIPLSFHSIQKSRE